MASELPPRRFPTPASAVAVFALVLAANLVMSAVFVRLAFEDDWFLVATPVLLLAVTAAAVKLFRVDPRETLMLRLPAASDVVMAFPLAISFVVLSDQLSRLTQEIVPIPEEIAAGWLELIRVDGGLDWIFKLSTIGLLAAVSEELLFRGFIQNGLRSAMGRPAAVLWTSFLFTLMHVFPLPSFAAAGIVLGAVALSSRSIVIPVLVHLANNVAALALVNLTGLETLADPLWVPSTILLPAVGIFVLTMGYFLRRFAPEEGSVSPPAQPDSSSPAPVSRSGSSGVLEELAAIPPLRRRTGWLMVVLAVLVGTTVLGSVFLTSVYMAFPRQVHASVIETLARESSNRVAVEAYERAPELERAFDSLNDVNEAGSLTWRDLWDVLVIYSNASADGELDSTELDEMIGAIREVVRDRTLPRRL